MKKFLILVVFLLFGLSAFAQRKVITTHNIECDSTIEIVSFVPMDEIEYMLIIQRTKYDTVQYLYVFMNDTVKYRYMVSLKYLWLNNDGNDVTIGNNAITRYLSIDRKGRMLISTPRARFKTY